MRPAAAAASLWCQRWAQPAGAPLASRRGLVRAVGARSHERGSMVALDDPPAVGYAPWTPGMPRRWAWPLFGVATTPVLPAAIVHAARATFGQGARYLGDEADLCAPAASAHAAWSEVAVIGRSNVGKSSLLNALLGSKDHSFVPVSRHPGSTMHIDFYGAGPHSPPRLVLVDTPGYGYNRHGRAAEAAWLDMLQRYLRSRPPAVLARTLVLLDARHGLVGNDVQVLAALDAARVPYTVVLTKADALGDAAMEVQAANMALALSHRGMLTPVLHAVSAHTGDGLPDLQAALAHAAKLHLPFRSVPPATVPTAGGMAPPAPPPPPQDDRGRHASSRPVGGTQSRWSGATHTAHDRRPHRGAPRDHEWTGSEKHARESAGSGTAVRARDDSARPVAQPADLRGGGGGGGGLKRSADGAIGWRRRRA
jgi:GTP-binding protein